MKDGWEGEADPGASCLLHRGEGARWCKIHQDTVLSPQNKTAKAGEMDIAPSEPNLSLSEPHKAIGISESGLSR